MLVVTEPIMPEQSGKSGLEAHLADAFPGARASEEPISRLDVDATRALNL